jgi:hypothetical protein
VRAELEEVDTEAAVAAEQRAGNVLRVAASSIVVADDLPNYCPIVKREARRLAGSAAARGSARAAGRYE